MIELPRSGDGKRRRRLRRARTKAEAQRLLQEMRDELSRNGTVSDARRTVADAIGSYRSRRKTTDQDDWALGLINEGLGALRLIELNVEQCDSFLDTASLGLSNRRAIGPEQMRKLRQALVAVLRNEMRVGRLSRNVAELSTLPPAEVEVKDRRALSHAELQSLLDTAKGSRLIVIDLCSRNGLRPAEARALRWVDLDLDRRELSVTGQQNRHNERGPVKRAHNAERTIEIDDTTMNRLKAWTEQQQELRSKAKSAWQDLGLVASTTQGTPIDRHSLARSVRLLCGHTNIEPKVTPYELRHTAISMQADAGRSSWDIADWAGTSEAMINRVYRHRLRRVARVLPILTDSQDETA